METSRGPGVVWLRVLYWYTILGAGLAGLCLLLAPAAFARTLRMPEQDPFVLGVAGSLWLAFGVVAVLGLGSPLAFAPIFLVQLGYKTLWLVCIFLPNVFRGVVPLHSCILAAIFASYVLLDIVAIPFRRLASG